MTNFEKEAIARKQNLAGVVKENKTGRLWGASIRELVYMVFSLVWYKRISPSYTCRCTEVALQRSSIEISEGYNARVESVIGNLSGCAALWALNLKRPCKKEGYFCARFDSTNQYMISSLSTSWSPTINRRGGKPPRYEFTGLIRGCDKRLFCA